MNIPNLPAGYKAPIIGRGRNEKAIKLVEDVLARLQHGELINVAVIAEQAIDGQMLMSYDVSPINGEAMKMRGALATAGAMIDRKLMGG